MFKSKFLFVLSIFSLILFSLIFYFISVYNNLISLEANVLKQWSNVETQYQRRLDLIPNLQAIVEGVSNFEKSTFLAVTEARSKINQINLNSNLLSDPNAFAQFQEAQNNLSTALSRLIATFENYPQLKASDAYKDMMTSLEGTENRIAVARKDYNDAVTTYNIAIKKFPAVIIANFLGFKEKILFQSDQSASKAPKVEFK